MRSPSGEFELRIWYNMSVRRMHGPLMVLVLRVSRCSRQLILTRVLGRRLVQRMESKPFVIVFLQKFNDKSISRRVQSWWAVTLHV